MSAELVTVERRGRVAIVRFDRGDGLNPMSARLVRELTAAAQGFAEDLETTSVVLAGERAFSAGRDLRDPEISARREQPLLARRRAAGMGFRLCKAWEEVEQFTVCAIERFAIGGGLALALACDHRVIGAGAHFRAPEIALGMNMSWGTIPRLVSLVGPARAKQILLQANDRVSAPDALAWGLVEDVAPDGTALDRAAEIAEKVAAMPPVTVRMTKQTVNAVANALAHLASHMDSDQILLAQTMQDHEEAVAAFKEKRTPRFTGG